MRSKLQHVAPAFQNCRPAPSFGPSGATQAMRFVSANCPKSEYFSIAADVAPSPCKMTTSGAFSPEARPDGTCTTAAPSPRSATGASVTAVPPAPAFAFALDDAPGGGAGAFGLDVMTA